jgi:hypothetical protein
MLNKIWIVFFLLFIGCKSHKKSELVEADKKPHWVGKKIDLMNGLGELSIMLPASFDTSFVWIPNYPLGLTDTCLEMAGITYTDKEDGKMPRSSIVTPPIHKFEIFYLKRPDCEEKSLKIDSHYLAKRIETNVLLSQGSQMELRNIDNKTYLVSKSLEKFGDLTRSGLFAETIISNRKLMIRFYCFANDCDTFLTKMESSFMALKIRPY